MPLSPGTRIGPYEIVALLGAGGMGEVYRARDTRLDRLVAVKVVTAGSSPQALERFAREAQAIAALNHPGICSVYDVGTSPVPFLVMELLDGETLHQRLARGPMDVPSVIDVGIVLADALTSAHAKGIVHRDLKPANIVLTPRGPKVLDFGLARITAAAQTPDGELSNQPTVEAQAALTDGGTALGTLAYMSPEQLRGEALDARTDLFSLGLVLYEMATGRRAFLGATSAVTSAAILHDQPAPPRDAQPDLSVRLEQAILTLLEKDREVRTQTAAEVRAVLLRVKRELSGSRTPDAAARTVPGPEPGKISHPPASATPGPAQGSAPAAPSSSDAQLVAGLVRRHRGALAAVAVLGLLAVAGATYFVATRGRPSAAGAASLSLADLKVEALTTSGTATTPTISPDGNYVVYVENGGGTDSLRVRQVASGSNVEIVPPEPGVALLGATVTPDGAFVNYVRQTAAQLRELWQVPFLGGSPRRLLPGVGGRVRFSPDGREMAFVRNGKSDGTDLVIAASDGSRERVLATRKLPAAFSTISIARLAPAWSPDGRTIAAFGGQAGEPPAGQVVFVDVGTGAERAVNTGSRGAGLPGTGVEWIDDHALLVSMNDRTTAPLQLWLLSYPEGTLRRLTNDTNVYVSPSLSADASVLVVGRDESSVSIWTSGGSTGAWTQTVPATRLFGRPGFRVRWVGDDLVYSASAAGGVALMKWRAATRATETLVQGVGTPSASRDGSTIVFIDYDSAETWKADSAGRNRVLLQSSMNSIDGGLSPDGRLLAWVGGARPGGSTTGLAVQVQSVGDPDRTRREVTTDRVRVGWAEISPDGRSIAFSAFDERGQPAVAVCDLEACASRRTLPALARTMRWMPDGRHLAYVDPGTQSDLWALPIDGGTARRLTQFQPDGQEIWDFDWSADGARLAVARARLSSDIVLFRGLRPQAR